MAQVIDEYIAELKDNLTALSANEQQEALEFYQEFLLDGNFTKRSEIEAKLGTPRQLARKILADYGINNADEQTENADTSKPAGSLHSIWQILLAICAAPIGIPLAITMIIIIVAVLIVCFIVLLMLLVMLISLVVSGIASLGKSFPLLISGSWTAACLYMGMGLLLIGLAILASPYVIRLFRVALDKCTDIARKFSQKLFKQETGK